MKKEFLDLSRDRRTLILALVVPLVVFPAFFGLGSFFSNPSTNPSPVLLVNQDGGQNGTVIAAALLHTPGISVSQSSTPNIASAISNGTYDVGVMIPSDFSTLVNSGKQANVTLYYDETNGRASTAVSLIQGVVSSVSQSIATQRLQSHGITKADLNPIGVALDTVRKLSNPSLVFLSILFPTFLLYFTFLGSFYFIVDDISGEKERRSLEALFILPPKRSTFFLGKFFVAFVLSMLTAALGLVGTQFSINSLAGSGSGGFSLPVSAYAPIFGITALASLSLTAIGFCVSTFAKNIREAQQYLSPIFFIVFIPIYFAFGLSTQQISQFSALPIVGYVLLIRDVVIGTVTFGEAAISLGVNLLVLAFLIWLAIRLLNSEKVVLRAA